MNNLAWRYPVCLGAVLFGVVMSAPVAAEETATTAVEGKARLPLTPKTVRGFVSRLDAERAAVVLGDALTRQYRYRSGDESATLELRYVIQEEPERQGYLIEIGGVNVIEPAMLVSDSSQSQKVEEDAEAECELDDEVVALQFAEQLKAQGHQVAVERMRVYRTGQQVVLRQFVRKSDAVAALEQMRQMWLEQWRYQAPDMSVEDRADLERLADFSISRDRIQNAYVVLARVVVPDEKYRVRWWDTPSVAAPSLPETFSSAQSDEVFAEIAEESASGLRKRLRTRAELMVPKDHGSVNFGEYLQLQGSVNWQRQAGLEMQLAALMDGYGEQGGDFHVVQLRSGESFLRWRGDDTRLTVGWQNVIWGFLDETPLNDRLSRVDLRRAVLDDIQDRRVSVPMVRWEKFWGGLKLDGQFLPTFQSALLPGDRSMWSPYNVSTGELLGVPTHPAMQALVASGRIRDEDGGWGGMGLRLSHAGEGVDWALTAQRYRSSLPYYELNESVRQSLMATGNPWQTLAMTSGDVFTGRHPYSWAYGGDVATVFGGITLRAEAVYLSQVPVTTSDLRLDTRAAVDWGVGVEWYPGDAEARLVAQVIKHRLLDAGHVVDYAETTLLNGAFQDEYLNGRWRFRLRYAIGLDQRSYYWNPELTWLVYEPHQWYLAMHSFHGESGTLGGYYRNNDMVTFGWRARF